MQKGAGKLTRKNIESFISTLEMHELFPLSVNSKCCNNSSDFIGYMGIYIERMPYCDT